MRRAIGKKSTRVEMGRTITDEGKMDTRALGKKIWEQGQREMRLSSEARTHGRTQGIGCYRGRNISLQTRRLNSSSKPSLLGEELGSQSAVLEAYSWLCAQAS